jgi:hypothetical protein
MMTANASRSTVRAGPAATRAKNTLRRRRKSNARLTRINDKVVRLTQHEAVLGRGDVAVIPCAEAPWHALCWLAERRHTCASGAAAAVRSGVKNENHAK